MAEAVVGLIGTTALGWVVEQLLSQVLEVFRDLKNASSNVSELQDLLERLESPVQILRSVPNANHPAGKWLEGLNTQLSAAHAVAKAAGGLANESNLVVRVYKRFRTSRRSLKVCGSIRALLQEASVSHWASHLGFDQILLESNKKIQDELQKGRVKDEELFQGITNLATREEMLNEFSRVERALTSYNLGESSLSSAAASKILVDVSAHRAPIVKVHFGGDAIADVIRDHVLEGEYGKWVALWGMGGIGKTFTASRLYRNPEIKGRFSGGVHWVTVSKDRPGPHQLCKELMASIGGPASVSQLPEELEAAKVYLRNVLGEKRVLLILDDVWEDDDGDDILQHLDLVSEATKSVILVTTRDKGIFRRLDTFQLFEIPLLSEDDSWQLFSWHAFPHHGGEVLPELKTVAKHVASECKGLPLALEVIGSTMADKQLTADQKAMGLSLVSIWESALSHLKNASHGQTEYKKLTQRLQMSVDGLHDSRLKDCFFYFAGFPEDAHVGNKDIIPFWVAEGLVDNDVTLGSSFSGEVEAKLLLSCLVAKSMLHMRKGSYSVHFQVHDVMRDIAQQNLTRRMSTGEVIPAVERDCLYAPGLQLAALPKDWTMATMEFKARRLSVMQNNLEEFPGPRSFSAPHLQVLKLSENYSLQALSVAFFQKLSNLRVLDLSYTGICTISDGIFSRLSSLVLLCLTGCRNLQKISEEMNDLHRLECLKLWSCFRLTQLPQMSQLRNLKYLQACVPCFELKTDRSEEGDSDLEHDENSREYNNRTQKDAAKQEALEPLPFELPSSLEELVITSTQDSLTQDSLSKYSFDFSFVKKLSLNTRVPFSARKHDGVIMVENLFVYLYSRYESLEKYFDTDVFPSLKTLDIVFEGKIQEKFTFSVTAMPKIEYLSIRNTDAVRNTDVGRAGQFPMSIRELGSLKVLKVGVYLEVTPAGDIMGPGYGHLLDLFSHLFKHNHFMLCLELLDIVVQLYVVDYKDSGSPFSAGIEAQFAAKLWDQLPTELLERAKQGKPSVSILSRTLQRTREDEPCITKGRERHHGNYQKPIKSECN